MASTVHPWDRAPDTSCSVDPMSRSSDSSPVLTRSSSAPSRLHALAHPPGPRRVHSGLGSWPVRLTPHFVKSSFSSVLISGVMVVSPGTQQAPSLSVPGLYSLFLLQLPLIWHGYSVLADVVGNQDFHQSHAWLHHAVLLCLKPGRKRHRVYMNTHVHRTVFP